MEWTESNNDLLSVKQWIGNVLLWGSFLYISNNMALIMKHASKASTSVYVSAAKVLFTTPWIFLDFQDIKANFSSSLYNNIMYHPWDDAFLRFANDASL